jgi:rfaE bifunctional protein kinase chain/domain
VRKIFENFKNNKILIIGDVMLDTYLMGHVDRISPEAPVPVVDIKEKINKLGGATNVALNIKNLGAESIVCSLIGADESGMDLYDLMREQEISTTYITTSEYRTTTNKTRVIGNNVQLIRVDKETKDNLNEQELKALKNLLTQAFNEIDINGIIIQDYNKGVVVPELLDFLNKINRKRNIPIFVDPKVKNFYSYRNINIFKPNFNELKRGINVDISIENFTEMSYHIEKFMKKQNINTFYTTLGNRGIFLSYKNDGKILHKHIEGEKRNVADVSGAGDTVISVASLLTINNVDVVETAILSNIAGGLVCEEVGVVPINKEKLLKEISKI